MHASLLPLRSGLGNVLKTETLCNVDQTLSLTLSVCGLFYQERGWEMVIYGGGREKEKEKKKEGKKRITLLFPVNWESFETRPQCSPQISCSNSTICLYLVKQTVTVNEDTIEDEERKAL